MNRTRMLRLRSEAVVDLGTDELSMVVGGTHETCTSAVTHLTVEVECHVTISNPIVDCLPYITTPVL